MCRTVTRSDARSITRPYRIATASEKGRPLMSAHLHNPLTATAVCECGAMCQADRPGHVLTAMRLRLATVATRGWSDHRILAVHADGRVELDRWNDGAPVTVWQHEDLSGELVQGEVVALHETYSVLAVGQRRFSVAFS